MTDAAKAGIPMTGITPENGEPSQTLRSSSGPDVPASAGQAHRAGLSDHAQARIGHRLRSLYDSILQQPVPDRFRELIDRLDAEEPKTP